MGLEPLIALGIVALLAAVVIVRWRGSRSDDWTEHPPVAPPNKRSRDGGDWPRPDL
jgi:hypothetical protein